MRHVDLDPVGAMCQLLAGGFARLDRAVDELSTRGHIKFRSVSLKLIASSRGDGASRDEQSRPGDVSALDGLFDADVAIARAFRLHVAQGGESLLQRAPRGNRGSGRTKRQRILQNVDVVSALCGLLTLQKDMGMRIDQAGQYGRM